MTQVDREAVRANRKIRRQQVEYRHLLSVRKHRPLTKLENERLVRLSSELDGVSLRAV